MATETGTLYALTDPRDGTVRYIGQTTRSLAARLAGHLTKPAPRVGAWIAELLNEGLEPGIVSLRERLPAGSLRAVERAEITRRLLSGESLLNESATAEATAVPLERELAAKAERERADWRRLAEIAREALGGPIPPGDLPTVPVPPSSLAAHYEVVALAAEPEEPRQQGDDNWLSKSTRVRLARGDARERLWPAVRGAWGHLRGRTRDSFEFQLRARVEATIGEPWASDDLMNRYLTLVPWSMTAVMPWAAMAARAGMAIDRPEFIAWVSDDPSVRDALHVLLVEAGDRLGPLDIMDVRNRDSMRPSVMLAAMTAAHCGFELPASMQREAKALLLELARDRQLTGALAEMLSTLDPKAGDAAYGPNLAADIDESLQLPAGTAHRVLKALIEHPRGGRFSRLEDVVTRAEQTFPTVPTPDYSTWTWDLAPVMQAITANFIAVGLLPPPTGWEAEQYVEETRSLWTVWERWAED
jgi:hypothetical protein